MADEQLIKPRELPAATTVFANDAIMTDDGVTVGKATPVQIVNAGAPVPTEAEAIAGTDNSKRMTPLTVKQVLDNVTAPSVQRAAAWAESSNPPDPAIPGSKSAKSWAAESERLGGEQAERAEAAAADAVNNAPWSVKDAQDFLSREVLVVGARYRSPTFAWDVVPKDTGHWNHPKADVGVLVVPVRGRIDFEACGGVPDYSGVPEYDGDDASRITATDNGEAFLRWILTIDKSGFGGFFEGHFGIKTSHASAITLMRDLNITGVDGERSVLDFIFEDHTGSTYITSTTANMMLRLDGDSKKRNATLKNCTIKATTFGGVIGGEATAIANVYFGKVWGLLFRQFNRVKLYRVKTERFNGAGNQFEHCDTVKLINCKGFHNGRSGYWAEIVRRFDIIGDDGEFAYNGFPGNPGTGYGVTGSYGIGHMNIKGGRFHHNYRKGADSHGCLKFTCTGADFDDNLCIHIGLPLSEESVTVGRVVYIDGNSFSHGATAESKAWMKALYQQRVANGYTSNAASLVDMSMTTNMTGTSDYSFCRNKVRGGYRGLDVLSTTAGCAYIRFIGVNSRTLVQGNDIDVPAMGEFSSDMADPYGLQLFGLPGQSGNEEYDVLDNVIKCEWVSERSIAGSPAYGAIFTGRDNSAWRFARNRIVMRDQWLFGRVGQNGTAVWGAFGGGKRIVDVSDMSITADRSPVTGDSKFFGRTQNVELVGAKFSRNVVWIAGVPYEFNFPEGGSSKRRATSPAKSYAIGDVVANVVFDQAADTYAKIKAYSFSDPYAGELTFSMAFVGSATVTGANTQVTPTVNQIYVDTDGVTKTSVVLTASAAIGSRAFIIDVDCISRIESYGIEKIVWA